MKTVVVTDKEVRRIAVINYIRWALALPTLVFAGIFIVISFFITADSLDQTLNEWLKKHF